ncbi:MAG TPA: MAPEG family protein [Magnetospirillaceae bacterium]|jgi:glutathione S-transferase
MTAYPLTALATLLAIIVFGVFGAVVTMARGKYGVVAPAISGHPDFERRFRVHVNTMEQLVMLLPVLWLCGIWVGDAWAGLGGLVWCLGRIIYAWGYYRDAGKREIGFYVTSTPFVAMLVADLAAIVIHWT